jgi:hypothetical protein
MDSNVKRFPAATPTPPVDERTAKLAEAVETLLSTITPAERSAVIKLVSERVSPNPRAGEVLGMVVHLFKQKRQWAVEDLKDQVPKLGVQATAKEIYNALSYLNRRNQIKKIAYGQYILVETGAGLVAPDEEDGTGHSSEHYD